MRSDSQGEAGGFAKLGIYTYGSFCIIAIVDILLVECGLKKILNIVRGFGS